MNYKKFTTEVAGRDLKVELGHLAAQADGSVTVTYGQTTVLATAVMSKQAKGLGYFPLTVEYEEKFYAAGKIKGSRFIKREGRPSDEAVLTARMIDRTLRPRFDQNIKNEIQIVLTVLSFDKENDPDLPALIGASLALGVSGIPFNGPMAGIRIGRALEAQSEKGEKWILNPTYQSKEESDFEVTVAGDGEKINMLEGESDQVPESVLLDAMEFTGPHIKELVEFQKKIVEEINPTPKEVELKETDKNLEDKAVKWLDGKLEKAVFQPKTGYKEDVPALEQEMLAELGDQEDETTNNILKEVFDKEIDRLVHQKALEKEERPDGRKPDEVRTIKGQVSLLARTHGSAVFERGETQALSVLTLGSPSDERWIDEMEADTKKGFMHHYNFPPFSVGETGRMMGPKRREIGHGALAEKALAPVIPDREDFPYTILLVSEILSSNGSSSMASTSGASLALMDGGVPVKDHVTGIAMGLMMENDSNYKILTDIQGPEDHHGDMDLKVAGTEKGVTAIQMDVKIEGVTMEILKKAFDDAKKARIHILGEMKKVIEKPREELSSLAPRVYRIQIDPEKIGLVIGPGGKTINEIIDGTETKIDIEDSGVVNITSEQEEGAQKAIEWIKNLTKEAKIGEVFKGKVTKITDFGAFVEIFPGQEGLIHISEIASHRVEKVEDELKTGQIINVKVKKIDELGRIGLTMKDLNEDLEK